ncbi:low molecular weight protein-tyrosine-phosphatase [uncultured Piscinibacter sp.]|uniref:low molecular weight protein-tyrosine-phosphatase n=1 Tax=uncultured Piscinibacter sp. TaxID=1131835 RepID=UPI002617E104|nr:low molecular weight protein-tyrosine-phosphatase [uncultured Piscinibacter sp.]
MISSVLFVCMGNICRSPTAEAVMRYKLREAGLHVAVRVDSAGTHAWHAGAPPDGRSQTHAARRGYDLAALRAREVVEADFDQFDLILAMDWDNLALLEERCPPPYRRKLGRLTEHCRLHDSPVVPDPYAGGPQGFEEVLDLVEDACDGLVGLIRRQPLSA